MSVTHTHTHTLSHSNTYMDKCEITLMHIRVCVDVQYRTQDTHVQRKSLGSIDVKALALSYHLHTGRLRIESQGRG